MHPAETTRGRSGAPAPHLRKQGSATQLIVDGSPFLVLGGELHNSSSSSTEYMKPIWERMVALNFNTVLAPVFWELVEPKEGAFDFGLVDGLIHDARRHNLRLILLWFGSWKNGQSSYVPAWVKRDYRRFPRAALADGGSAEVLSTLADASWQADARAFAALMRHLRVVDGDEHTVIMVQVQNEVGLLGDSRDRSELAERAFAGPVPDELLAHLAKHTDELVPELWERWKAAGLKRAGTWAEVFGAGPATDEIFMAWHYARYVDRVAAIGKAEYDIPMFANAWLNASAGADVANAGGTEPGRYPSGGPLPHVLDLWLAGAPHIDILAPDIYFGSFEEWCRGYTRRGNPLFIPEMRRDDEGARAVFYAIGQHDAIGTSPFAVDSMEDPADSPLARSYAALRQVAPLLLDHQGRGATTGFLLDKEHPSVTRTLGEYELEISLDEVFFYKSEHGYGLLVAVGPDEFVGAGSGFRVRFRPKGGAPGKVGIASVDEGAFHGGRWVPGRRLNGDENDQGRAWRFSGQRVGVERCTVYRYE
jgi:beta-galactosidase GanA